MEYSVHPIVPTDFDNTNNHESDFLPNPNNTGDAGLEIDGRYVRIEFWFWKISILLSEAGDSVHVHDHISGCACTNEAM